MLACFKPKDNVTFLSRCWIYRFILKLICIVQLFSYQYNSIFLTSLDHSIAGNRLNSASTEYMRKRVLGVHLETGGAE